MPGGARRYESQRKKNEWPAVLDRISGPGTWDDCFFYPQACADTIAAW
jgi:hypothetical protein